MKNFNNSLYRYHHFEIRWHGLSSRTKNFPLPDLTFRYSSWGRLILRHGRYPLLNFAELYKRLTLLRRLSLEAIISQSSHTSLQKPVRWPWNNMALYCREKSKKSIWILLFWKWKTYSSTLQNCLPIATVRFWFTWIKYKIKL